MRKFILAILFLCVAARIFGQNSQITTGNTLGYAINKNDIAAVKKHLEEGADPNGKYRINEKAYFDSFLKGTVMTYSQLALYLEHLEIVELLFEYGADSNTLDNHGRNIAYYLKSQKTFDLLVSKGIRFDIVKHDGVSPLMYYIHISEQYPNRLPLANFVLGWEEEHSPVFSGSFENRKDYLLAAFLQRVGGSFRDSNITYFNEHLLSAGADINDIYMNTKYSFQPKVISLYLERKIALDIFDKNGETLLTNTVAFVAVTGGGPDVDNAVEMMRLLLMKGADPNGRNSAGETALMKICARGSGHSGTKWEQLAGDAHRAAEILLRSGADPNLQDNEGKTALMHLGKNSHHYREIYKLLVSAGADPSIKDNNGKTALHYLTYRLDTAMLEDMISRGCDLNESDIDGMTPLMYAVQDRNDEDVFFALLEKGADPLRRNNKGKTALNLYLLDLEKRSIFFDMKNYYTPIPAALLAAGAQPADMDDEGDSALSTVLRISKKRSSSEKKIVWDLEELVLQYASADEIKTANASAKKTVAKERREGFFEEVSENLPSILGASIAPVVFGGLSIWMREGVFANDPSSNFMGTVNVAVLAGTGGLLLGGLLGSGGGFIGGLLVGTLGVIGGIIIACLPSTNSAFKENAGLYYASTALNVLLIGSISFTNRH